MLEKPFSLDRVTDLPRYIFKDSYQTVLDKSGYDHLLPSEESHAYLVSSGAVGFLPIIHYHLVAKFHIMYIIRRALWRRIFYVPKVFRVSCISMTDIMLSSRCRWTEDNMTFKVLLMSVISWLLNQRCFSCNFIYLFIYLTSGMLRVFAWFIKVNFNSLEDGPLSRLLG